VNERIKELRNQASSYAYQLNPEEDSYGRPVDPAKFQQDRDTKFAELIVKECAEFIAPLGDWCGGHGEPRAPSTKECAAKLKQHFGVE
jgi:hypothetical protein